MAKLRTRALGSGVVAGAFALAGLFVVRSEVPNLWDGLTSGFGLAFVLVSALAGLATLALEWTARFEAARYAVAVAVGGIVAAWVAAQAPYLLPPDLTVDEAAAWTPRSRRVLGPWRSACSSSCRRSRGCSGSLSAASSTRGRTYDPHVRALHRRRGRAVPLRQTVTLTAGILILLASIVSGIFATATPISSPARMPRTASARRGRARPRAPRGRSRSARRPCPARRR